ncbi:MAG: phosphoglucosamine mutase [Pyrodictiaceae archaeon]
MGRLFGTDGVRGITNTQLTPMLALRLGLAIGSFFGQGSRIIIGRDSRSGGDMISHAVMAGLQAAGVKVYYAGLTPTPALQLAVRLEGFDGGIMITASHNPPEYNGIKVISSLGVEIDRDKERQIEEIFFSEKFRYASWRSLAEDVKTYQGVLDLYVTEVVKHVDRQIIARKGFKVGVDCANNVGSLTTPRILRMLGVKPYTINCELSPFPSREPEPTPDSLQELRTMVRSLSLDLGVGHDGDADRAIIVDDKGEAWWGDRTAALLSAYVYEHKTPDAPPRVYTAVSSSVLVEEYLSRYGLEVKWTPVGAVNISYSLLREGGVSGFEENGGFMYPPHQLVRDGGITVALFLEMMARENVRASELFQRLPRYYAVKTKLPMERDVALKAVEAVKDEYKKRGLRVIEIDGVKVFGEDWWVLVRPSGTEPVLRIMAEAVFPEKAEEIVKEVKEIIKSRIG